MKRFISKQWIKLKNLFKYIWKELKDWNTLLLFGIVCAVFYFPVYGFIIFGFVFQNSWWYRIATAVFWAYVGPVPYWPICITTTLILKYPVTKLKEEIKYAKFRKEIKWVI